MRAYRVTSPGNGHVNRVSFWGTKPEAHAQAKLHENRAATYVDEVEVQTDKVGVVAALNGTPLIETLCTWGLTPRGGLREEPTTQEST